MERRHVLAIPLQKNNLVDSFQAELTPERKAQLRLIRSENVGPITFYTLLKNFGSAINALQQLPVLAERGGRRRPLKVCTEQQIDEELKQLQKFGAGILFYDDRDYPSLLRLLSDAPPVLTYKGNLGLLKKSVIGIVGARNASLAGKQLAEKFARDLGEFHYAIASGLARGIDAAAHKGSLEKGTIAVVAGGIDVVYPPENQALHDEIYQRGLVIAESAFGTMPQANLFPRRNCLISGLSQGILIIEAALKSGSLLTAQYALDQHREIFAIPGSPLDPRAQGCNRLIQEGAALVQTIEDIISGLERLKERRIIPYPTGINAFQESKGIAYNSLEFAQLRQKVEENLSVTPICVDELIRECQISGSEILMILVELELSGKIIRYPGNKVALNFVEL
jgi:DNA processing protein